MAKWAVAAIALILYGFLCYQWGSSNKEVKIITKENEVIKYETQYKVKEVCNIMVRPNLNHNDIISLYEQGKL